MKPTNVVVPSREGILWIVKTCLIVVLAACNGLTDAGSDGLTPPNQFDNADGAVLRANAAVASFALAQGEQVTWSGIVTDELKAYVTSYEAIDALHITVNNAVGTYPYGDLTNARLNSLRAITTLEKYAPKPASRIGELFVYAGLVELYFAEDMCSGVPLANIVDDVPSGETVLSRDSLLSRALAHFDSAAKYVTDSTGATDTQLLWLAQVASGRALLSLGEYSVAAKAVAGVPGSFVSLNDSFDGNLQVNDVWLLLSEAAEISVADREGGHGLPFISGTDPRVPITNLGAPDGVDTIYAFSSYAVGSAPIVLASGTEASLIRAEAALRAGDVQAWADTLNALRVSSTSLSSRSLPVDSTTGASPSAQENLMFRERAFWLFLTGHRQGDLRRLVRQYGRTVASVFPAGNYWAGGAYGTDVTFVPVGEASNPTFRGCLDRNP